jgi:nucleoside-diphosphate-sugar epimerase
MSANTLHLKKLNPLLNDLDHILTHTEGLWEELRGKRLFITGGTGFFGCWLLESFAWANDRLNLNALALVLTRDYDAFRKKMPHLASNPSIQFQIGDVRTFAFPEGVFSHIIHAATPSNATLNNQNPLLMFDTIVEGTRHTLDFAVHCGAKKFLLTSSGAVYGKQPPDISHLLESYWGAPDLTDPNSAYGEGKRAAELLCTLYSKKYGIESKVARCFAFIGPYLPFDIHYAIGNFILDGLNGGPIVVKGDGTPYRSYLYAADLAIWLWTILFIGKPCRPYNVGSEESIAIVDLAYKVAKCFQIPIEVSVAKSSDPNKPLEQYIPSTNSAREECGIGQIIALEDGIRRTIAAYKEINISSMLS